MRCGSEVGSGRWSAETEQATPCRRHISSDVIAADSSPHLSVRIISPLSSRR